MQTHLLANVSAYVFVLLLAVFVTGCSAGRPGQADGEAPGAAADSGAQAAAGAAAPEEGDAGALAGGGSNGAAEPGSAGDDAAEPGSAGDGADGGAQAGPQGGTDTERTMNPDGESLMKNADLEAYIVQIDGDELGCNPVVDEDADNGQVSYVSVDHVTKVYVSCNADTSYELLTMNRESESAVSLEKVEKSVLKTDDCLLIYGSASDEEHWTAERVIVVLWQ